LINLLNEGFGPLIGIIITIMNKKGSSYNCLITKILFPYNSPTITNDKFVAIAYWNLTLLPLKMDVPHEKCTQYKIMTMTFWRDWRPPISLYPKSIFF
jgi:hypothetical protein